jgi:hypothetical protein
MGIKRLKLNVCISESQRCAVLWHSTLLQSGIARMDILFSGKAAYLLDMSRLLCSVRLALHSFARSAAWSITIKDW